MSVSFRARSPRRVDVTDGMIAGRLALLCAAAVVFLIVWTLFMPPQVKHSTGDLRFKQCEYSVMNYVSLFGEYQLLFTDVVMGDLEQVKLSGREEALPQEMFPLGFFNRKTGMLFEIQKFPIETFPVAFTSCRVIDMVAR